jgi:hypothetical protein
VRVARWALVIGGTGMLARCTAALVAEGWHVVLPSRRYAPIPDETSASGGQAIWVEADWADPKELADRAERALGGPADLLVAWVHGRARPSVLRAVDRLLAAGAPVVEVHGSASANPIFGCPDPILEDHPTQQVVLGFIMRNGGTRWLTQAEIAEGVLDAVGRALDGRPAAVHQVGEFRTYPVRGR